jgi:S1-C subfamily serine protease
MEPVGTTIKLAVRRDGKERNLKLVLRDLVPESPREPVKPVS